MALNCNQLINVGLAPTDKKTDFPKTGFFCQALVNNDATCTAIREAISDLFWQVNKSYLSIFYFSGHGLVDSYGNLFLASYDVKHDEPFVNGINQDELQKIFFNAQHKDNCLMILDCCYSGIATKGDKSAHDDYMKSVEQHNNRITEIQKTGKGKLILSSCGKSQKSTEKMCSCEYGPTIGEHYHGIFTFHLLKALRGDAKDDKCDITLAELSRYIDTKMPDIEGQRPEFKSAETSGMWNVRIAKAKESFVQWYKDKIQDIQDCLDQPDAAGIMIGLKVLYDELLEQIPEDDVEVLNLKKNFQERIKECIAEAKKWLTKNRLEPKIRNKMAIAYSKLEKLVYPMDEESEAVLEKIVKLNDEDRASLSLLFDVCMGPLEVSAFINSCQGYNNPTNTATSAIAQRP